MKLYALTYITLKTSLKSNKIFLKNEDGSVNIYSRELGVFSTIDKAERFMKKWIKDTEDWGYYSFCYIIREKILDDETRKPGEDGEFYSFRSYLPNGELFCDSDTDSAYEKSFNGRRTSVKMKKGDYCWVLSDTKIRPAKIIYLPYTKSEWKKRFKKDVYGDGFDDSYTVMFQNGHDHPFSPLVFPYFGKMSKKIIRKIESEEKKY